MSRVTLYSLLGTRVAYPSAAFGSDDMRSMTGLYAFGALGGSTGVTPSRGLLGLSDKLLHSINVSDQMAHGLGVSDG